MSKLSHLSSKSHEMDRSSRIEAYFHCAECLREFSEAWRQDRDMSPSDFQDIEVGCTDVGIQVWCKRHNRNVIHFDFEGMSHPTIVEQAA